MRMWTAIALGTALLASSLTLKATARQSEAEIDDAKPLLREFLIDQGFLMDGESASNDFSVLRAHNFTCGIKVIEASPSGWHEDLIHRLADPGDRVTFFFEGRSWERQPRWRSWASKHWRSLNRLAGRAVAYTPVFGVVASNACRLDDAAWAKLTVL